MFAARAVETAPDQRVAGKDTTSPETAAKVVIYEHGKESRLDLDEGVYIWIRSTDPIGDSIWCGDLATNFAELFRLMKRDRTIAIAPWPEVGFSFFLFDESRHGINEVGDLLVACARI